VGLQVSGAIAWRVWRSALSRGPSPICLGSVPLSPYKVARHKSPRDPWTGPNNSSSAWITQRQPSSGSRVDPPRVSRDLEQGRSEDTMVECKGESTRGPGSKGPPPTKSPCANLRRTRMARRSYSSFPRQTWRQSPVRQLVDSPCFAWDCDPKGGTRFVWVVRDQVSGVRYQAPIPPPTRRTGKEL
jgi:hypothetical protein